MLSIAKSLLMSGNGNHDFSFFCNILHAVSNQYSRCFLFWPKIRHHTSIFLFSFRWKDGEIRHVHVTSEVYENYKRRISAVLDSYYKRFENLTYTYLKKRNMFFFVRYYRVALVRMHKTLDNHVIYSDGLFDFALILSESNGFEGVVVNCLER